MQLEDQHRFHVWGAGDETYGAVIVECRHCPWRHEWDTTDLELALADVIDKADEHPDCRPKP